MNPTVRPPSRSPSRLLAGDGPVRTVLLVLGVLVVLGSLVAVLYGLLSPDAATEAPVAGVERGRTDIGLVAGGIAGAVLGLVLVFRASS